MRLYAQTSPIFTLKDPGTQLSTSMTWIEHLMISLRLILLIYLIQSVKHRSIPYL